MSLTTTKVAGKDVGVDKRSKFYSFDRFTLQCHLTDLKMYTTYEATVEGYTSQGSGPKSSVLTGSKYYD